VSDLRQRTIHAASWSLLEKVGVLGIGLFINIILARLLSPTEYGLIGNIAIFTVIANTFIDGGFASALIQKQNTNDNDYTTIFVFNLVVALLLYFVLFACAPLIAAYFNEPSLNTLLKFVGLLLIFNSLGIIQSTLLTKNLDFKPLSKTALISNTVAGLLAIGLAFLGYGVWSLAWQLVFAMVVKTLLLWYYSTWRPKGKFKKSSLKDLFGFGSNMLFSSLLESIYQSAFSWIINKRFSLQSLGFYTQAKKLQEIPVLILSNVIGGVTFPALAKIQDDTMKLKFSYKKILQLQVFVNFPVMLGLIVMAKPIVAILLTAKWLPSVPYIQLLALAGMLYTLQTTNLNILKVKGRSDIFFRLEVAKKIIGIILIFLGLIWGIYGLVASLVLSSYISFFINSYFSGRLIHYPVKEQLMDLLPYLFASIVMAALSYGLKFFLPFGDVGMLICQGTMALVSYILISLWLKLSAVAELKLIVDSFINKPGDEK